MTSTLSAPSLRLDAEYRYWLGDRELISVTTALKEAGLIDTTWFTPEAAERGTAVHLACEQMDKGTLDYATVPAAHLGFLEAYARFLADAKPEWEDIERPICDATVGYAGTLDRFGLLNERWTVLDIKTGPPAAWHGLQLAAYARCAEIPRSFKFDLYLTPLGTYRLEPQRTRTDEANFLAALAVAQFRRTHGPR